MVLLERSKVRLTCELQTRLLRPGDIVSGTVHLDVKEKVTFSSLRLHITGTELLEVMVQEGTNTMILKDELPYVNHCITITGPAYNGGDRTRQSYEVGAYTFPFSLTLPVNCPPSFALGTQSGRATMRYCARAVLEIPSGFDATCEQSFQVLSVAPRAQYSRLSCGGRQEDRTAPVYRRAVLCCLCGRKEGCHVRVTAKTAPGVFCVGPPPAQENEPISENGQSSPPQQSATVPSTSLTVYLCVDNTQNDEELQEVKIQLRNVCAIAHDRHESMFSTPIASTTVSEAIPPGEAHEIVVELPVPISRLRRKQKESYELPLPTFATSTSRSTYFLDISFPRNAVGAGLKYVGLVNVVHEVATLRGLHDSPSLFRMLPSARPTEVRYVAIPARVEFPADVQALYECEPHMYLPADCKDPEAFQEHHALVAGASPDETADPLSRSVPRVPLQESPHSCFSSPSEAIEYAQEANASPTGTVDAVVVHGNVVRGVMQGMDHSEEEL